MNLGKLGWNTRAGGSFTKEHPRQTCARRSRRPTALPVGEVARLLGVHVDTVRDWCVGGELACFLHCGWSPAHHCAGHRRCLRDASRRDSTPRPSQPARVRSRASRLRGRIRTMPARTKFTEEIGRKIVASIRKAPKVGRRRACRHPPRDLRRVDQARRGEARRRAKIRPRASVHSKTSPSARAEGAALFVCDELDRIDREFGKSKGDWNRMRWKLGSYSRASSRTHRCSSTTALTAGRSSTSTHTTSEP